MTAKGNKGMKERAEGTSIDVVDNDDDFVDYNQKMENVKPVVVKEKEKKCKKRSRGEDVGIPSLRSRSSPHSLFRGVKTFSREQQDCVRKLGFDKFLSLTVDGIPGPLAYFVVDNLDTNTMTIKVEKGVIKITKEGIHELTRLPIGGVPIVNIDEGKTNTGLSKKWRLQHGVKEMSAPDIVRRLEDCDRADWVFMIDFVMLFISTMIECSGCGKCLMSYLTIFKDDVDIKGLDWCDLIYRCIKECKTHWKRDDPNDYFVGALTILMMTFFFQMYYVESTTCLTQKRKEGKFALQDWTLDKLKERQNLELEYGGFGKGDLIGSYVELSEKDEEMVLSGFNATNGIGEQEIVESRRSSSSPYRLFLGCTMLNERNVAFNGYSSKRGQGHVYHTIMRTLKYDEGRKSLKEFDMVFFPIQSVDHNYVVVFDLKNQSIVLDSVNHGLKKKRSRAAKEMDEIDASTCRTTVTKLKEYFVSYLKTVDACKAVAVDALVPKWLNLKCATKKDNGESGIFTMRHMETFMGEEEWDCGLLQEPRHKGPVLLNLRKKYAAKILLSDINLKRVHIQDIVSAN